MMVTIVMEQAIAEQAMVNQNTSDVVLRKTYIILQSLWSSTGCMVHM